MRTSNAERNVMSATLESKTVEISIAQETAALIFARLYAESNFEQKPKAIREAFKELAEIVLADDASLEQKSSALDSMMEILFPGCSDDLGLDLSESKRNESFVSDKTERIEAAMDRQEAT